MLKDILLNFWTWFKVVAMALIPTTLTVFLLGIVTKILFRAFMLGLSIPI